MERQLVCRYFRGLFWNCEASATGSQPDKHTGNARAMKIRAQRTDSGARLRASS